LHNNSRSSRVLIGRLLIGFLHWPSLLTAWN